ncbi:MAG TPA: DUF484 family protein [Usitatibacteraceae bacterium]
MSDSQLNIDDVAEFLRANPDFFEQHADVLLALNVAHPHGGRTVSIPERQLIATREKVRLLETKLAELIQFGEENDLLSDKVQQLTLKLIDAPSLNAAVDTLYLDLLDRFRIPHVAIRLWNVAAPGSSDTPEFQTVAPELRQFVEAMTQPYCGGHPVYETHLWFGEHAPHLKSYAMVPLKMGGCFGLLLMASESAERFYADMGTLFLTRIGDTFAHVLARQLTFLPPGQG